MFRRSEISGPGGQATPLPWQRSAWLARNVPRPVRSGTCGGGSLSPPAPELTSDYNSCFSASTHELGNGASAMVRRQLACSSCRHSSPHGSFSRKVRRESHCAAGVTESVRPVVVLGFPGFHPKLPGENRASSIPAQIGQPLPDQQPPKEDERQAV